LPAAGFEITIEGIVTLHADRNVGFVALQHGLHRLQILLQICLHLGHAFGDVDNFQQLLRVEPIHSPVAIVDVYDVRLAERDLVI